MRSAFRSAAVLLALAAFALPARAQRVADLPSRPAPAAVGGTEGTGFSLGALFNRNTLRVSQSYEMSYSSFGGSSLGLGVYTTSLRWQPSDKLAARVDVGVAHSPFGSSDVRTSLGFDQDTPARVYLRNAELAYRPTENAVLSLRVSHNPFGNGYGSPYGYSPYGYGYSPYGSGVQASFAPADNDALFWRDGR